MKLDTHYQHVDPEALPRWAFIENGVGCAAHRDPNCLCDVNITTPVDETAASIVFAQLAAQAVGGLKESTFPEFASILLGCWYTEKAMPKEDERQRSLLGNGHKRTGTPWSRLDDTVRDRMRAAYRCKMPWREAKLFLPETLDRDEMRSLMLYYNQQLHPRPSANKARANRQKATAQ
jgi:hypothetical protein